MIWSCADLPFRRLRLFPGAVCLLCVVGVVFCTPALASAAQGATGIATGESHSCAAMSTGGVYCWGLSNNGQLGDGTAQGPNCSERNCSATPVQVRGLPVRSTRALRVRIGAGHARVEQVLLGAARYRLRSTQSKRVRVRLKRRAMRLLDRAAHHRLRVMVWATLRHGSAAQRWLTLGASGAPRARSGSVGGADFFARNPNGGIQCGMSSEVGSGVAPVVCEATTPHRQSTASLYETGKVLVCVAHKPLGNPCDLGNPPLNTPTYGYGHRVTVGRFRCTVRREGVRCTIRSTGKGFLFSPVKAIAVGGATLHRWAQKKLQPESPAKIPGTWMAGPGCESPRASWRPDLLRGFLKAASAFFARELDPQLRR